MFQKLDHWINTKLFIFLLQCKLLLLFHTSFFNKKFVGKMFAARPAWVKKIIMTSYFFSFFCKKKETIKIIFQSLDSYQLLNVVEIFLIMMICFGLRLHVLTREIKKVFQLPWKRVVTATGR